MDSPVKRVFYGITVLRRELCMFKSENLVQISALPGNLCDLRPVTPLVWVSVSSTTNWAEDPQIQGLSWHSRCALCMRNLKSKKEAQFVGTGHKHHFRWQRRLNLYTLEHQQWKMASLRPLLCATHCAYHSLWIFFFNPHTDGKTRHREAKQLTKGHTATEEESKFAPRPAGSCASGCNHRSVIPLCLSLQTN